MKIYVGITDNEWFNYMSRLPEIDEVNFWQPNGDSTFKSLKRGELFLNSEINKYRDNLRYMKKQIYFFIEDYYNA